MNKDYYKAVEKATKRTLRTEHEDILAQYGTTLVEKVRIIEMNFKKFKALSLAHPENDNYNYLMNLFSVQQENILKSLGGK